MPIMKKKILLLTILTLSFLQINAQTITDFDGNIYNTVVIGNQIWMQENLRTTHFRNGISIPKVSNSTTWYNLFNTGGVAMCFYDNDSAANASYYGALYNWHAAHSGNNLCPADWHVPTDAEWTTLTDYLQNNGYAFQGTAFAIAKSMADTSGWTTNGTAGNVGNNQSTNNSSFFSAVPGGNRSEYGTYTNLLSSAYWWTYTASTSFDAWNRSMNYNSAYLSRNAVKKEKGAAVRCICDFLTTDVPYHNKNQEVSVYPNPSNGIITVAMAEESNYAWVDVLNVCGKVILTEDFNNQAQITIDFTKYAKGLYFIKVRKSSGVIVKKILIE